MKWRAIPRSGTMVLLLLLLLVGACSIQKVQRELSTEPPAETLDGTLPYLKAHFPDGHLVTFSSWHVDEGSRTVTGPAVRHDPTRTFREELVASVAIDSVAIFESNVLQRSGATGAMTVMTVASAGMTVYCIANPKACFGSCPTFYAPDVDGGHSLQAEGFSASVAPVLEDDDLDALPRCRTTGRRLVIDMTNEALETHVVRSVDLLAVPRSGDGRVISLADDVFRHVGALRPPRAASGPEGDILGLVGAHDGRERTSLTDPDDLAAREELVLEFDNPRSGPAVLVVTSRQALVSTYLFYQGLAYLGRNAAPALARARQVLAPGAGGNTFGALLGRIEIAVAASDGTWRTVGEVGETGPLAPNTHALELGDLPAGPATVRLRLAQGNWRLDHVALASLGGPADPLRIAPTAVWRDDADDPDALDRLTDPALQLVTYPGDRYSLVFELPSDASGLELFLHSRGYYLEWMRTEWMAEENASQAAAMVLAPRRMLQELAPAYKQLEPDMEAQFWGSRYAR